MPTSLDAGVRPTIGELKEVFETEYTANDGTLEAFLNTAHRIVDDELSGSAVSDATKEDIEKYAAAYLATSIDPRIVQDSVGDSDIRYQRAKNEDGGKYLSIVQALDPTGKIGLRLESNAPAELQAFGPGR